MPAPRSRTVRIDEEVYAELQRLAREWQMGFDSPNNVLRRALSLPPRETMRRWPKRKCTYQS